MYCYKFIGDKLAHTLISDVMPTGYVDFGEQVDWTKKEYVNGKLQDKPVIDPPAPYVPTLDEAKRQKRNEINWRKDEDEAANPFMYLDKPFDYDSKSRERLNVAIQLAQSLKIAGITGSTKVTDWKLYDNTLFEFTVDALCEMPGAFAQKSAELHQKAWLLKAQVDAAETVEQVNAIEW